MNKLTFICLSTLFVLSLSSSMSYGQYDYEISPTNPYGLPNPKASQQIKDFSGLIGECKCSSTSRNQDQSWAEPIDMTWTWKYNMNGMAVQDETLKADGKHSGSIRQYHSDSSQWYVHYYSSNGPTQTLPVWTGGKKGDNIVLYRSQPAPSGQEGFYRLTFYDINDQGYKWVGEWVDLTENIVFPTWKIDCEKLTTHKSSMK